MKNNISTHDTRLLHKRVNEKKCRNLHAELIVCIIVWNGLRTMLHVRQSDLGMCVPT